MYAGSRAGRWICTLNVEPAWCLRPFPLQAVPCLPNSSMLDALPLSTTRSPLAHTRGDEVHHALDYGP